MHNGTRREVREVAAMAPQIDRVSAKIATLERRAEWLEKRLSDPRNDRTRSFDEAEHSALEAAIKALNYHRAALDPETDPVLALSELVDSIDEGISKETTSVGPIPTADEIKITTTPRILAAVRRARVLLEEIEVD